MDKFEIQRRVFTICAVLLLLSVLALIAVIPVILQDTSPGAMPRQAAIATSVGMLMHLLIFLGILYGIRLTKRKRKINKEINLATALVLLVFGFIIMDGALAGMGGKTSFISIGMFFCAMCDLGAIVVSVVALFLLRTKKKQ